MNRGNFRDYRSARGGSAAAPAQPAPPAETHPRSRRKPAARLSRPFGWRPFIALVGLVALIYLAYGYVHTKHQLDQLVIEYSTVNLTGGTGQ